MPQKKTIKGTICAKQLREIGCEGVEVIPLRRKEIILPEIKAFKSGEASISVWEITEPLDFFGDIHLPDESELEQRNLQWLASRKALNQLGVDLTQVEKDEYGKPQMLNHKHHISLSHCKQYAAAISGPNAVGIDVEEVTPRVERIAKRFVHPREEQIVNQNDRLTALYVLWSAKEALYKLYGKRAVDFRDHLIANPFELETRGKFYMEFVKNKPMLYVMRYELFNNHVMVWVEE